MAPRLALLLATLAVLVCVCSGEPKSSAATAAALCNKFPDYCDDKKGSRLHQRFAETKWRKPKGESEIRGHLAPKRPVRAQESEVDEAERLRASTIREAEERLRLTAGTGAEAGAGAAVDSRRTVSEARRKAHLIQEVRRRRRQRLEEQEHEQDEDDDDEMEVEVEEDDEVDEDESDDESVEEEAEEEEEEEEPTSEELLSEDNEDEADAEEESEEEYVVDQDGGEEVEDDEEGEESEEQREATEDSEELEEEEDEDEDEALARKKLREVMQRRRKWREEEERMKRREEERRRVEEEQKKREEEGRRKRIEELRRRKREREREAEAEADAEEANRRAREEEEQREEAEERQRELFRRQKIEQERLLKLQEEQRRKDEEEKEELERRKQLEEKELQRRKQLEEEEELQRRKQLEEEELQRRKQLEEEELQRRKQLEEEERVEREREQQKRLAEEEERVQLRKKAEDEGLRKLAEEREQLKKRAEEARLKKEAEEKEQKRKTAEVERLKKEAYEKIKQRKKVEEEERLKKEAEEKENQRKKAEEEERLKKEAEEKEKQRKKAKEDEEERLIKEAEEKKKQARRIEEERLRKQADEKEKQQKKAEEEKLKIEAEEKERQRKKTDDERIKMQSEEKERQRRKVQEERLEKEADDQKIRLSRDRKETLKKQLSEEEVEEMRGEMNEYPQRDGGEASKGGKPPPAKRDTAEDDHHVPRRRTEVPEMPDVPWMAGFPEFFAPTADDDVKNELCKKHSRIFVQHLTKYKSWALHMYDATAKLPSGVLSGNAMQLGDFDQCLAVDVRLRQRSAPPGRSSQRSAEHANDAGLVIRALSWLSGLVKPILGVRDDGLVNIHGRYCLASLDVDIAPSKGRPRDQDAALRAAMDRALAHSFIKGSLNDSFGFQSAHFVPRFRTLSWGVCVPATCEPRDVEAALRGAVTRFQASGAWGAGLVRARLAVPAGACRDAHYRLPQHLLLASGAAALLGATAIIATLKDTGESPEELGGVPGLLASFSLKRCWAALTAPEDPGADDIRCIHGVRAICSVLLYVAHKLVPLTALPFSNRARLAELAASPASMLLRSSFVYTDTFLLLSGVLASYHLSRHLGRGGNLDWGSRIATRVLRLTPTLGAVVLFYAHVLEHLGSGPLWGQLVEDNASLCRESLWRNLLYIQNFWPFQKMCAPHTHQLALDMQLFVLVPPLVWLLHRAWPVASPLILTLIGGSTWLRQRAALEHRVSLLIYNGIRPADLYRAADVSYALAAHRASAYLVGVVLGHALHRLPRKVAAPKLGVLVGWVCCLTLGGWALFGQRQVARPDYRLDVQEAARFSALAPLAWAAAAAWLIFACHTGNGGTLNRLLCARPLVLLSRISYAFYLTQFLIFFHNAGSVRSQREFSVLSSLDLWELLLVLLVSVLLTLLVDLPMQSVRSAYAGGSGRRRSLKWSPPTPAAAHRELAAVYYYGGTDVYTEHSKED